MSKIPYIAAGCGVAFVVWGIAFLRHEPSRPHAAPIEPLTLQERFDDAIQGTVPFDPRPRIIKTERIFPAPIDQTELNEIDKQAEEQLPVVKSNQHRKVVAQHDRSEVCRVHGMRRVYVSKHRWRCKR